MTTKTVHASEKLNMAMENLAILDGMKRDGWDEHVIDRVERTMAAAKELLEACRKAHSLISDECDGGIDNPVAVMLYDAIAKAEGRK